MKKQVISIIVVLCLSLILGSFTYKSNATGLDIISNPDLYKQSTDGEDNDKLIDIGNIIVWVVRTIGEAISIVMLLVIGIKYILGSVEEKAEYKQSMWPYVVGAILIFSGAALTDIIYKAFN